MLDGLAPGVEIWVEGLLVFEDGEDLSEEVVHDGANDAHLVLAGSAKTLGSCFEQRVVQGGHDGWEVEGLPQVAVAGFAEARLAANGAAGLVLRRGEPGIGSGLTGVFEVFRLRQFGEHHCGGASAHAGNAAKELGVFQELWISADDGVDLCFKTPNSSSEVFD